MLQFRTILHPTDFSERAEYAYRLACSLARDHGARLVVLHVWKMPPVPVSQITSVPIEAGEDYPAALEEELRLLHVPDPTLRVEHRLEQGDAATEIVRVAEETNCDLIVMGSHGRSGLGRLVIGSVTEQVLRKAPCPVLAVKAPVQSGETTTASSKDTAPFAIPAGAKDGALP